MSYVNGLSQRQNEATPVRPVNSIPRNHSLFQAHLNAVPVRSAATPAPVQAVKTTTNLVPASQQNSLRQILGASPAPAAVQADPVKAPLAATPFNGNTPPAITAAVAPVVAAAATVNRAADLDHAMQIASQSNTPTPLVRADGSLDWDAYTNNITDPQQKADMVNQLTFDYHYRQEGASGQRQPDNAVDNWGWDPYKTMQARRQYGYTWVPNMHQNPIAIAPGLSMPGTAPYNPTQPPEGSITVS